MKSFSHCIFSILALVLYLGGNALIEVTHHDELNILLHSKPTLESHNCGAKEIHLSVENARHCLACSYFAQRLSTETHPLVLHAASIFITVHLLPSDNTVETDVFHSGERGPPSISV